MIPRRDALKTLAMGVATSLVPAPSSGAPGSAGPSRPSPVFFTPGELEVVDLLSERIIPTDESSPGAKAAHVAERIDSLLKEASDERKAVWREGLAALERICTERYGKALVDASAHEHDALLATLASNETRPATPAERLFTALKSQTVEAYYTSEIGLLQELRYQGNTYLADFKGCTHEEHHLRRSETSAANPQSAHDRS